MENRPELIVMLTHNDVTVKNAKEVFEECKNSKANFWGFKEVGIPLDEMKELYSYMKQCGKTTFLEVVAYTEEECMEGAKMGVACGVDYLLGTLYFDSINDYCKENGMKYLPFVGTIEGRPSVLKGTMEEIIEQGKQCLAKGVAGFDLLGYRYVDGDPNVLAAEYIKNAKRPVCLAGSIGSEERMKLVKEMNPWTFTMGSALFTKNFVKDGSFRDNLKYVVDFLKTL